METSKNARDDSAQKIVAPVVVTANATSYPQPEFIRLPKSGTRDAFSGLSRSGMNSVILATKANNFKPPVKSVVLRRPGSVRGVRLIVAQSLREYLYANLATQEGN
jgi:hypothetical protein